MKYLLLLSVLVGLSACSHGRYHGDSHKRHKKMFAEVDADSDGKVSKAEYDKHKAKHFEEVDTNKDGFITKDEKKSFMKKKWAGKCSHSKHSCGKKACDRKDCPHKKDGKSCPGSLEKKADQKDDKKS